jgi:hypothetical protein
MVDREGAREEKAQFLSSDMAIGNIVRSWG